MKIPEPTLIHGYRTSNGEIHPTMEEAKVAELKYQMEGKLRDFDCVDWCGGDFYGLVEFAISLLSREVTCPKIAAPDSEA